MPKIKTLKSAYKRFKKTSSGLFKRKQNNLRHLLTKKDSSYKRNLGKKVIVSKHDNKRIKLLVPYM
ncbi:50S ribosomal protein L35 [Buchnera aphidicola (Chaitoregma tattakana)]|uniref:50S ribosomal protein L35 n=1 Tax=Buchnera aphidicola TaxID=9 RepID=UPI0031B859C0